MKIRYPEYDNCIANLACSILGYYGIEPPNPTLTAADELLKKRYKNIVVLLLDGMGVANMTRHLSPNGFFVRNMRYAYSSTFPPTTVAATTAIESGLYPNQSGWLGWTGYFDELDRNVVYFFNTDYQTKEKLPFNAAETFVPYENICNTIERTGVKTHKLAPFIDPFPASYGDFCDLINDLCSKDGERYIYAYWHEPDHSMHDYGTENERIGVIMKDIEGLTERLADNLSDTLLIITADHGHINNRNTSITDYPDLIKCLVRMPSMEVRALNLFVKEGMEKQFETAFNRHYNDSFMLLPKAEVLKTELLGRGKNHKKLDKMLGDYLAVAISDVTIANEPGGFIGNHAGLTEAEMTIPLIAIEKANGSR